MNELPFIDKPDAFQQELKRLATARKKGKTKTKRAYSLSKQERQIIHAKTAGKCHICGREVPVDKFEVDHVISHARGGTNITDNFLAACRTCNNYRWDYLPEEFQWILKLGVWARTEIETNSGAGKQLADIFISREIKREARRKIPRTSQSGH